MTIAKLFDTEERKKLPQKQKNRFVMSLLKFARDFNDHVVDGIYGKLKNLAMADLDPPIPFVPVAALLVTLVKVPVEVEVLAKVLAVPKVLVE
ncbi:hypothetical protein SLA2020_524040 [Shorea laevis]